MNFMFYNLFINLIVLIRINYVLNEYIKVNISWVYVEFII